MYALGSVYGEHWYDNSDLAVFRFTADGKYVDRFGGGGNEAGQFRTPNAIAVDNQSRVYVCDQSEGIHVFTADGRYLETLKTPFWVQGMAFDTANDLYVVGDNKVAKLLLSR
jgi:sugar lactone lactonase YvrE